MAIDITKAIEGNFYPFREELVLDSSLLDGRLAEFTSACEVVGRYVVVGTSVYFDAKCSVKIDFKCDKCLAIVPRELAANFGSIYYLEGTDGSEGDYPYNNYVIDIMDAVREDILLEIPTRVLCQDKCKGICPICGIDLNVSSCDCLTQHEADFDKAKNPFSVLKDFNKFSGGASNGSTKG